MAENSISTDPSLPLQEDSLMMPPPVPNRSVRFYPDRSQGGPTPPASNSVAQEPEDIFSSQVDGSSDSLNSDRTTFQAQFTMRECEEQISGLKKENFNLKLRIYFMEESQGLLHSPKEQAELYKVNIDLKVKSEELKKDLEEQRGLLSEAARALQSQEEKQKERMTSIRQQLAEEQVKRKKAEESSKQLLLEVEARKLERDQILAREEMNRTKISDQSKLLYAEAFGSINLGKDDGDANIEDVVALKKQAEELNEVVAEKDKQLEDLQSKVEQLQQEVEQARNEVEEADGYNFTVVEEIKQHAKELEQKDAVVRDCRTYIDSLTDQVNARSEELEQAQDKLGKYDQLQEEVDQLQEQLEVKQSEVEKLESELQMKQGEVEVMEEKLLNSSQLQARDEEIAGLQAELALTPREGQTDDEMEVYLERIRALEAQLQISNTAEESLKEEKKKVSDLKKEIMERVEAQQKLEDELSSVKMLASQHLQAREEAEAMTAKEMTGCNRQITELRQDLNKRNEQVIGFVQKLKEIKRSIKVKGRTTPELEVDCGSTESLDWDYEGILEHSSEFIQRLVGETDDVADVDDKLEELQREKEAREEMVKKLEDEVLEKDENVMELRKALENSEVEQEELMAYLNSRLGEIRQLKEEMEAVKESKIIWEQKLQKSLTAIQGFVTENQKLQEKVAREEERRVELEIEVKKLNGMVEEEKQVAKGIRIGKKQVVLLSKQRDLFAERLAVYRGRFDQLLNAWKSGRSACEMMRVRLEELAFFLQQLIDAQGGDVTLDTSCLSLEVREGLQRSIDESRMLSISVLAEQTSMLEEMDLAGLAEEEDVEQEEWTVPDLDDVDNLNEDGSLDLDEAIKAKEMAENKLVALEAKVELLSRREAESQVTNTIDTEEKGSRARVRRTRSVGGSSGLRKDREGRKATSLPVQVDSDSWSEPDKAESRARIGLHTDSSSGKGGRRWSSEDEVGEVGVGIVVELRRERGRVERLRLELKQTKERVRQLELDASKGDVFEKEHRELELRLDDYQKKLAYKGAELESAKEEVSQLVKDNKSFEVLYDQLKDEYQLLVDEVEKWQKLAEDRRKSEDLTNLMAKMEIREEEMSNNLNSLLKKLDLKEKELIRMKSEYSKKEMEMKDTEGKFEDLQERCTQLESEVKENGATIFSHEENLRILKYEMERQDASIKVKDENLATAETLLKELNESKKEVKKVAVKLKKDLEQVNSIFTEYKNAYNEENLQEIIENRTKKLKEDFEHYKRCFNEEITENRVNEVETRMRGQAEGMKKLAEELLKIEANARRVESEKAQLEADCRAYEKEVGIVSATLKEESYKASQLGKTVENLRENQKRLETEMLMKQSLEKELTRVQEQLTKEKVKVGEMENDVVSKEEKVKALERNIKCLEMRRQSSDKVFAALAKEGEKENFTALNGGDLSRQELEAALVTSRPGSRLDAGSSFIQVPSQMLTVGPRRQGLSLLDHNTPLKPMLTGEKPLVEPGQCSCDLSIQLQQVKTERDAALSKLKATRSTLSSTTEKLSNSNRRKKEVEKAICRQLSKTHDVLKKTKENLENQCEPQVQRDTK